MRAPDPEASVVTVRPLAAADRPTTEQFADAHVAGSPYADIVRPPLASALHGGSREFRGLAAHTGSDLLGVAVYGEVAGTTGTARLHLVAVTPRARRSGVARQLVNAAAAHLARDGNRLLMVELPDDPALRPGREFLLRSGFEEESRVPDFYRDGVALVFLRRRLPDG